MDAVRASLRSLGDDERLHWSPVALRGLDFAWVGMAVPSVDSAGRPWVWEVVRPDDFETRALLQDDPMVLPVAQDTIVVSVLHADHSGPIMRMQVPVSCPVESVEVDGSALPGHPWSFSIETGWTAGAIGTAAQCWIDREVGGAARLETPEPALPEESSFRLTERINIESSAFDRLLTLDPHDAAVVSSSLANIHDALSVYR